MTPDPKRWTEALASEHQREAKLVIMQAIADATDMGLRRGWEAAVRELRKAGRDDLEAAANFLEGFSPD